VSAVRKLDAHIWEREEHEHYVEPSWCSARLLDEEAIENPLWDPCCGFGTIVENAKAFGFKTLASDIVHRSEHCENVLDFFSCKSTHARSIVCNPPFNIADRFALHALSLAHIDTVAMIFPTARLNAAHWLKGTPLARVWLLTPRPSMPPGHVIAAGEKPGGGKMDYCWLVWTRDHDGPPELRWLRRDGGKA
jgi:hypothetical protein